MPIKPLLRFVGVPHLRSGFLIFAILCVAPHVALAQIPTGLPDFGTYDADGVVTTNLAYLSLHIEIPLRSSNARNVSTPFTLVADQTGLMQGSSPDITYGVGASWALGSTIITKLDYRKSSNNCSGQQDVTYTILGAWDGHNTYHGFGIRGPIIISQNGCPDNSSGAQPTTNGWSISASVSTSGVLTYSITEPNGNFHTSSTSVQDLNGNVAQLSGLSYLDASGNTVLTTTAGLPTGNFSYNGPIGSNGPTPEQFTPTYTTSTIATNFGCPGETQSSGSGYLLTKLTRPDGTFYSFTYEPTFGISGAYTGRIASITLPTGGVISYSYSGYGTRGINCVDGSTAGFTKTTPDGAWTYSHTTNNGNGTTTVTAPSGDYVVYTLSGQFEEERQAFSSVGTPLGKTITCYNANFTSCSSTTIVNTQITQTDVYFYPGGSTSPSLVETKYTAGVQRKPTQITQYDFGASMPPGTSFVSRTTINYGSWNGSSCTTTGNTAAVCSIVTSDAGGPKQTRYNTYDANSNLITQKDLVSGTSNFLIKQYSYDSTGLIHIATDVNNAQTTYSNTACNNSFPTTISEPLGLSKILTWDCTGEVITSISDENSQPTQYSYLIDPFWRVLSTTDPAGAVTTTCYGAIAIINGTPTCVFNPNQVETVMSFNSGNSVVDKLVTTDGLGRQFISQTKQGPTASNFDTVSTTYDIDGRVASVSVPCVKTAGLPCPATPATTTAYDGLSRPQLVTDAGGGTTTYSYPTNDISVTTGPAPTSQRQMEYDGAGRLTSVCEVTANTLWPPPGACGQKAPLTGYWTRYQYDGIGRLTGVCENTTVALGTDCVAHPSTAQQTRTYSYDGLSRLTSESNPEWNSASASYTYDTISSGNCSGTYNGDLLKKVDPAGNVTCSVFDQLHRATSITYPSGPNSAATQSKTFVYDSATVNSKTMLLAKGRMAEAYTGPTGSKTTDLGFSYDADGRTIDFYESTPNSSGYYDVTASYWENNLLKTLKGVSLPTLTYGLDGEGRPNAVSASAGVSPVSATSYNPSGQATDVTFGSTDPVHFAFDSMGRMTQYKVTINGTATHGDPAWNANGTLGSLTITDPFNASDAQTCNYGYDDMARLASAHCGASIWQQDFTYDPFGNITKSGTISWQPGYNESANQYLTSANCVTTGAAPCYDADGNLLKDGTDHVYTWDADGHPVTLDTDNLVYDALGREVEVFKSGAYTEFVFGPTGKLALMNGQTQTKAFVPLPGGTQVKYAGSAISTYRLPDWLGSFRVGSNPNQTYSWGVAFAPFGEMYAQSGVPAWSFTGEEGTADTVSDEYDFLARKLHSTQGRWISPEPAGLSAADPADPQSWNRYAYVINNPLSAIDPLGLFCVWDNGSYDSNDDPDTGSKALCEGNGPNGGGTWFNGSPSDWDHNAGDWSGQESGEFATWASGINPNGVGTDWMNNGTGMPVNGLAPDVPTVNSTVSGMLSLSCILQPPVPGTYTLGPKAHALFQPAMTSAINSAFASLNSSGITPMITSGFRTAADQQRMLQGGSGPNPAAAISWHQAGMAVDLNTMGGNFNAIRTAMTAQGLTWGGTFHRPDPVHFQLPPAGSRPTSAMISACGGG